MTRCIIETFIPTFQMLTIFSIPKPFDGLISIIQRNAVESWRRLPDVQVILMGDDEGVGDIAKELGTEHVPDLPRNEVGTPLLNAAFAHAQKMATKPLLCYVNADIVLLSDFLRAVDKVNLSQFLLVGNRWNLDVDARLPFEDERFDQLMREAVERNGTLHGPLGSDYFVFPRGQISDLPQFAVGRPGWDNWMIFNARRQQIPVIDITPIVTVIHQNHDYGHVAARTGSNWESPEADRNREIAGGLNNIYTLFDATHVLTEQGLQRPRGMMYLVNRVLRPVPFLRSWLRPFARLGRRIRA